jgi:hypothetical protein
MRHLNLTELARLVDELPGQDEAAHIEDCARCRGELAALREQTSSLASLADPQMPAGVRDRIGDRVLFELAARRRRHVPLTILRAAAGILLFLSGTAVGTLGIAPSLRRADIPDTPAAPASLTEAAAAVARTEAEYLVALTTYAELSENGDGLDPMNRLAALEGIVLTTRAALREAPADPVINNYHLTAIGQRDALLRRLERLSVGDEWF